MGNTIIVTLLIVTVFGLGLYVASKITNHIENKSQHKQLMKNLRDFEMRDIMDKSQNTELKNGKN
jgi:hypothetical protein|tara:strand:+ start:234 stop:428 length:195 start_codon:yes stop_codon:yes gene_type:complete